MSYAVKEIFLTLQGEGTNSGRVAVFCRFAGCNLWTGRDTDRTASICSFCDTDFVGTNGPGGGKFATADDLSRAVLAAWPSGFTQKSRPLVVCTGGEPLLQLDTSLIDALHARGFEIAVETNGTLAAPSGIDWMCVSPKGKSQLTLRSGQELKLVFPQREPEAQPHVFDGLDFQHFFLQPMDGPALRENTARAVEYCLTHPQWRLSVQTHKVLGIP